MATPSTSQNPSGSSEIDETNEKKSSWEKFKSYLKEILESSINEKMNKKRYMEMHTYLVNFREEVLDWRIWKQEIDCRISAATDGYPLTSGQLYFEIKKSLQEFLSTQLKTGEELKGEELLQFYAILWGKYHHASKVLQYTLDDFNRYCIRRLIEGSEEDAVKIYWLALITWKEIVFEKLHVEVTNAMLDLIEKERGGETIDTSGISAAIKSYAELGFVDEEEDDDRKFAEIIDERHEMGMMHLAVYEDSFENLFLQKTENFYMKKAADSLKETPDLNEFPQKLAKCLEEEERRIIRLYLRARTGEMVHNIFQDVFWFWYKSAYVSGETVS